MTTNQLIRKASQIIWLLPLLLGISPVAQSQIVMTIDTVNETFSFSGTDSGTGGTSIWRDFSIPDYNVDTEPNDPLVFTDGFSGGGAVLPTFASRRLKHSSRLHFHPLVARRP